MLLRQVDIEHFRGIDSLTWRPPGKIACLIGRGDSMKTTLLEAIELALTPRYDPAFSDVDFFRLDPSRPIKISATVGDLPDSLQLDSKYGLNLRGWDPEKGVQEEPNERPVLTIRLTVGRDLEPHWVAWTEAQEKPISAADRAALGIARIGANTAWHLAWSRRSALSRSTESPQEPKPHLAQAVRVAREGIAKADLPKLARVAESVEESAKRLGVSPLEKYQPGLSPLAISLRHGALSLHDGEVPLSRAGQGTTRLAAIAVQQLAIARGSILLLDEVELGLEPHRIRHLIQLLRDDNAVGQVLLTSHSPIAVTELSAKELGVVHSEDGVVAVKQPSEELQGTIRASAEALLSRSIIVCEGKTEVGMCRSWDQGIWRADRPPLAQVGTYPIEGGGGEAPRRALDLQELGYRVALFRDADVALDQVIRTELEQTGVTLVEWADAMNTESRIAQDLPWHALKETVALACDERGSESVREALRSKLGIGPDRTPASLELDEWRAAGIDEAAIRKAIAAAATVKKGEWFKRVDLGERLGEIVGNALPEIPESDLSAKVRALETFAYGD